MKVVVPVLLAAALPLLASTARAQESGERSSAPAECTSDRAGDDGATWLARALDATGVARVGNDAIHLTPMLGSGLNEQSDRPYPPYILAMAQTERWFRPATGLEIAGGSRPGRYSVTSARAAYVASDTSIAPATGPFAPLVTATALGMRALNPHAVLTDWSNGAGTRVAGVCEVRGYPRVVLERDGAAGTERLFLDEETGFPVKLERTEPHYLWGDAAVEYIYATWWRIGPGIYFPISTTRYLEREVEAVLTTMFGRARVVPADSVPRHPPPPAEEVEVPLWREYAVLPQVDTVRIGADAFLLTTPIYTQAVVLARDTVFLLDATTGEGRARADSAWIGKLFPGQHPVALVVTDLAWPHIAGVRFWVSAGATVISHPASLPFLERVIEQRWVAAPDRLERQRAETRLDFRPAGDSLVLGGGAVVLYPIGGVASEGALMAWLANERLLWAGDYVQSTDPTLYTTEVARAARRVGIEPANVAAQHLPVTDWASIAGAAADSGAAALDPPHWRRTTSTRGGSP